MARAIIVKYYNPINFNYSNSHIETQQTKQKQKVFLVVVHFVCISNLTPEMTKIFSHLTYF